MSRTTTTILIGGLLGLAIGIMAVAAMLFGRSFFVITDRTVTEPTPLTVVLEPTAGIGGLPSATVPATATGDGAPTNTAEPTTGVPATVAATTAAPIAVTVTNVQYVQAQVDVNIRSGPGTGYSIVGWVAGGQTAQVTGVNEATGWWRVVCPDGSTGSCWVSGGSQFTKPATAPGSAPTPTTAAATAIPVGNTTVQYVQAQGDINIRSGPGTGYSIVGWVAGGQIAKVTGVHQATGWWRVVCPDGSTGSCWVSGSTQFTKPTTAPGTVPTPTTPAGACTDKASLVADVTVPDNTQFAPNTGFNKTWRIKNTGTCTWNNSYQIVHAGGTLMGAVASAFPLNQTVAPGSSADITISMVSPAATGLQKSDWRLQNANGQPFGIGSGNNPFFVKIIVTTPSVPSTISGVVFQDWNENGVYDAGDTLMGSREVLLIPGTACHVSRDLVAAVTHSGADGVYTFKGNYSGNYCVGLSGVDGLEDARAASVSPGQVITNIHLRAFAPLGSISGFVWNDFCRLTDGSGNTTEGNCVSDGAGGFRADGMIQPSEVNIAGVTVVLQWGACLNNNAVPVAAVTDGSGRYTFGSLNAGTYCVSINAQSSDNANLLLPGWWTFPQTNIGYHEITLTAGATAYSVNFGWDHQFN